MQAAVPEPTRAKAVAIRKLHVRQFSPDLLHAISRICEDQQAGSLQLRHKHQQLQKDLQEAIDKKAELAAELAELVTTAMSCCPARAAFQSVF